MAGTVIGEAGKVVYFDSAATSYLRPPEVARAVAEAIGGFGSVGRGVYGPSLAASMAVYGAREKVARLLGAPAASSVAFAHNATEALNMAIGGLLPDGGKAVTTVASHNSVLRPLMRARDLRGCTVEVAPVGPDAALDLDAYARMLDGADLVVATHASNLTGDVYDVAAMARQAHEAGARFVLDAAQTAGALPLDMRELGVDVLCFTGHKALLGPQGTGGLCVAEGVEVPPLLEGGTGTHSFDLRHPRAMPDELEAGTLNAHGLAGLAAGVDYLQREGVGRLAERVAGLTARFEEGVRAIAGVRVYGGRGGMAHGGIVALNVGDADSATVGDLLARTFGVCTRAGAHCAPLMHRALGTERQGAVRFSFSPFNTEDEVDWGIDAIVQIARELG